MAFHIALSFLGVLVKLDVLSLAPRSGGINSSALSGEGLGHSRQLSENQHDRPLLAPSQEVVPSI